MIGFQGETPASVGCVFSDRHKLGLVFTTIAS
jgi:hypothetical protein